MPPEDEPVPGFRAAEPPRSGQGTTAVTAPDAGEKVRLSVQSLHHLAEATGGFAAADRNDYGRDFGRR